MAGLGAGGVGFAMPATAGKVLVGFCSWGLMGTAPARALGRFTGLTPRVLPGTDGLSWSCALGCGTGSQQEAAGEPTCNRDPSLHQPGPTATEPPSNAISFEVEEGNDLF